MHVLTVALTCAQVNKDGLKLQCSHFRLEAPQLAAPPVVIYCHCNSGSRRDAEEALHVLLPHDITVFTLDFAVRLPAVLGPLVLGCMQLGRVTAVPG